MNLQQKDNSKIILRKMNYLPLSPAKLPDNSARAELSMKYLMCFAVQAMQSDESRCNVSTGPPGSHALSTPQGTVASKKRFGRK